MQLNNLVYTVSSCTPSVCSRQFTVDQEIRLLRNINSSSNKCLRKPENDLLVLLLSMQKGASKHSKLVEARIVMDAEMNARVDCANRLSVHRGLVRSCLLGNCEWIWFNCHFCQHCFRLGYCRCFCWWWQWHRWRWRCEEGCWWKIHFRFSSDRFRLYAPRWSTACFPFWVDRLVLFFYHELHNCTQRVYLRSVS